MQIKGSSLRKASSHLRKSKSTTTYTKNHIRCQMVPRSKNTWGMIAEGQWMIAKRAKTKLFVRPRTKVEWRLHFVRDHVRQLKVRYPNNRRLVSSIMTKKMMKSKSINNKRQGPPKLLLLLKVACPPKVRSPCFSENNLAKILKIVLLQQPLWKKRPAPSKPKTALSRSQQRSIKLYRRLLINALALEPKQELPSQASHFSTTSDSKVTHH